MGAKKPTAAELEHMARCKVGPCIPCLSLFLSGRLSDEMVFVGGDYDHKKSGNIRRGHLFGFCSCAWHHRGHPWEGRSHATMRDLWGPSLMDGSRLFREHYGSDDDLIALQERWLREPSWMGWLDA